MRTLLDEFETLTADEEKFKKFLDFHCIDDNHLQMPLLDWKEALEAFVENRYVTEQAMDSMDGDHESALTSVGWGTDESYGGTN